MQVIFLQALFACKGKLIVSVMNNTKGNNNMIALAFIRCYLKDRKK
jgi:hypothetical protein